MLRNICEAHHYQLSDKTDAIIKQQHLMTQLMTTNDKLNKSLQDLMDQIQKSQNEINELKL